MVRWPRPVRGIPHFHFPSAQTQPHHQTSPRERLEDTGHPRAHEEKEMAVEWTAVLCHGAVSKTILIMFRNEQKTKSKEICFFARPIYNNYHMGIKIIETE